MNTQLVRKKVINNKNRQNSKKYELNKIVFNYLWKIKKYKLQYKFFNLNLHKYGKKSSISKIKNICVITSRSRGVLKFYKLSRIKLKEFCTMGLIPGLRKSSW